MHGYVVCTFSVSISPFTLSQDAHAFCTYLSYAHRTFALSCAHAHTQASCQSAANCLPCCNPSSVSSKYSSLLLGHHIPWTLDCKVFHMYPYPRYKSRCSCDGHRLLWGQNGERLLTVGKSCNRIWQTSARSLAFFGLGPDIWWQTEIWPLQEEKNPELLWCSLTTFAFAALHICVYCLAVLLLNFILL